MFIPIGLIAFALDHHTQMSMQAEATALDNARAHELWWGCTQEAACMVVLAHNDWTDSGLDRIRVQPDAPIGAIERGGYREPADLLGPGPHGVLGVQPGRHTVGTRLGDRWARKTFTLFPREALCLRLDRETASWHTYDKAQSEIALSKFTTGELNLVNYYTAVAVKLMNRLDVKTTHEAFGECIPRLNDALRAAAASNADAALEMAKRAGDSLHGCAIYTFEPITSLVGFQAFELAGKRKWREAKLAIEVGLVVLPDDPTMLAVLGELCIKSGEGDGRVELERALAREAGLDERMKARARELLGG